MYDANRIDRNPGVWDDVTFPSQVIADELKLYISKRLTPQPTKIRADVEITCFGYDGIEAIKTALRTAKAKNTEEMQVEVRVVAAPLYVISTTCLDKSKGITRLEEAIGEVKASVETFAGGRLTVKMAPQAVTEGDDAELKALMDQLAKANEEVSGDDSNSELDDDIPETV